MKYSSLLAALTALCLAACGQKPAETPSPQVPAATPSTPLPAGHPSLDTSKMPQAMPQSIKAAPAGQFPPQTPAAAPSAPLPAGHPSLDTSKMPQAMPQSIKTAPAGQLPPLTQKAQVLSAINVTEFTYLEVKQDNNTRWLAGTTTPAKKGDTIQFDDGTLMTNFTSKTLNRTFPSITFVSRVVVGN